MKPFDPSDWDIFIPPPHGYKYSKKKGGKRLARARRISAQLDGLLAIIVALTGFILAIHSIAIVLAEMFP